MSKDTFYFSHDYNARFDTKIKALIFKHGLLGYGIFWAIIEDLYNNANELQTDYERIAFELREDKTIIESVIKDFGLFVFDGKTFGSLSVEKRLEQRDIKSEKARESANNRWAKYKRNADALPTDSEGNAIKERKGIKEKEILFYRFWDLYDKKEGRKDCERKFAKLKQTDIDKIFETLPTYIASTPDKKFRKMPETYLNGEHWNDEIVSVPQQTYTKAAPTGKDDKWYK